MITQLPLKAIRHRLERRVAATAGATGLLERGDHIVVALSGGPDSVALLLVLASLARAWRLTLSALHVNYGLRGEESEGDERFVRSLCDQLGIPLICERVDVAHASPLSRKRSLQERAREVRYALLEQAAMRTGAHKIAVGHTADDQAETLVMWMVRGSGAAGLAGIPPARDHRIVRPLLTVTRAEILAYLKMKKVGYRSDSSNAKPLWLRNRIRHGVMPLLKELNPSVVSTLTRQAAIVRDEDRCLERMAADWVGQAIQRHTDGTGSMPRRSFLELPIALQRRVVRSVMRQMVEGSKGPSFRGVASVLKQIARGRSGSSIVVQGVSLTHDGEQISFVPASGSSRRTSSEREPVSALSVPVPSESVWPLTGQTVRIILGPVPAGQARTDRHTAVLDADRFTHRLIVRSWQPGDVFHPAGMGGKRKKLQDFFTDLKLPRRQRASVPLLVAPEGILWVMGYRMDHRFCVTSQTKRVLTVQLLAGHETNARGR